MYYDFCQVEDIESFNRQICPDSGFSTSSKPTEEEVKKFVRETSSFLRTVVEQAGYDLDNLHEVSGTAQAQIEAGSDKTATLATGEGDAFTVGEYVKIEGLVSNVKTSEYVVIKSITDDVLTFKTVLNTYASGAILKQVNDALNILRDLTVVGVSLAIELAIHSGTDPNVSNRYQELKEKYYGSKENQCGIWAIQNVEDFLRGASTTTESIERLTIQSYMSEHEGETEVDPVITKDMDF